MNAGSEFDQRQQFGDPFAGKRFAGQLRPDRDVLTDREMREQTQHYPWQPKMLECSSVNLSGQNHEFLARVQKMMQDDMPGPVRAKYDEWNLYQAGFDTYKRFQLIFLAYNRAMGLQDPRETRSLRVLIKKPDGRSVQSFLGWVRLVEWCNDLNYVDKETWRICCRGHGHSRHEGLPPISSRRAGTVVESGGCGSKA